MSARKALRLVLLGLPGSGKGTQGKWAATDYGAQQISTGDLLRNVVQSKSALGASVAAEMAKGGLVSDATNIALLRAELDRLGHEKVHPGLVAMQFISTHFHSIHFHGIPVVELAARRLSAHARASARARALPRSPTAAAHGRAAHRRRSESDLARPHQG